MTERPILFSAPMVRAVLAGTKTQTRRALRVQPPANTLQVSTWHHPDQRPMFYAWARSGGPVADHLFGGVEISDWEPLPCPYGQPSDRLWVREAWGEPWHHAQPCYFYRADDDGRVGNHPDFDGWKPSIHMPRAASRITLEVTGVRVERLQAISAADAISEGIPRGGPENPDGIEQREYRVLWEQINGPSSWDANPWVWVVEFRRAS